MGLLGKPTILGNPQMENTYAPPNCPSPFVAPRLVRQDTYAAQFLSIDRVRHQNLYFHISWPSRTAELFRLQCFKGVTWMSQEVSNLFGKWVVTYL